MADTIPDGGSPAAAEVAAVPGGPSRKEKRKALKKLKRKQVRQEAAIRERQEKEALANDPEEQIKLRIRDQEEAEAAERDRKEFEERERLWLEAAGRKAMEEAALAAKCAEEEAQRNKNKQLEPENELEDGDRWEYVEEGPAEIIWQGNEIIVKKKRVRIEKKHPDRHSNKEDDDRPTSNPLPPQSAAFASHKNGQSVSAKEVLESVAQQTPNFGTEQDKAHCPFHLKTGACRFGQRCSRVHFYPDKSCTMLIKNMYNGPGLAWEQDEGLEYTDEEVERCYEEFYDDVHTEFLKFGELVNFKVCKNGSHHLRGNVYVHYKSLDSAILAYNTMNGRFFAGKQITTEFIGVTRWKVAICGEYLKLRLKTCSHGSACNFIHCFRNPGGDYEWADWDNPPPRYWIKKMASLFGPSVEAEYEEQMRLESYERPRDSSRKTTPNNNRHQSRRSYGKTDIQNSRYGREASNDKADRCSSRSPQREHSNKRRKGTSFQDRHEQSKKKYKTEVHDHNTNHCCRSPDSGEDSSYEHNKRLEDHPRDRKHQSDSFRQKKGNEREKSERNCRSKDYEQHGKQQRFSDQIADHMNDEKERSNKHSSNHSPERYFADTQDRYVGTCSTDLDSDSSDQDTLENTSDYGKHTNGRREHDRSKPQHYGVRVSLAHDQGRKENSVRKKDSSHRRYSSDESGDAGKTTSRELHCKENDYRSIASTTSSFSKKRSRSDRKMRHHREKEEDDTNRHNSNSDVEYLDSNKRSYDKKHSRRQTPIRGSRSPRRERGHRSKK